MSGLRPAETARDRLIWVIDQYAAELAAVGELEPIDYSGELLGDVLEDIAETVDPETGGTGGLGGRLGDMVIAREVFG